MTATVDLEIQIARMVVERIGPNVTLAIGRRLDGELRVSGFCTGRCRARAPWCQESSRLPR